MELLQTQVSFFINGKIAPLESFVLGLKTVFPSSQIQYFPNLPDEANLNIPRLILSVTESKLTVTIYDSRVDMVFAGEIDSSLLSSVLEVIITNKKHISRIGLVKTDFQEENADHYRTLLPVKKIEGLDVKEVGVHINVRREIAGHSINSIEKANPGSVEKDTAKRNGIVVQRDCNTLADEQLSPDLTAQQISELIQGLSQEAATSILI